MSTVTTFEMADTLTPVAMVKTSSKNKEATININPNGTTSVSDTIHTSKRNSLSQSPSLQNATPNSRADADAKIYQRQASAGFNMFTGAPANVVTTAGGGG